MASGRLRCIDSVQRLKNRFGGSYQVDIRCASEMLEGCIHACLNGMVPNSMLEEQHGSHFRLQVNSSINLGELFKNLEFMKSELGVFDYSVSQSTLDRLFMQLAKEENDEERKV